MKALADEIALIDHPISDDDLTLYILNGLGSDFREIAAPIRARETSLAFEELHDILVGHESYLRCLEASTQQLVASKNYSHRHKQNSSSYGGSHSKGSYKANGPSRPQGQNKIPQGPSKDNRKFSNNRSTQRHYPPKCQFCDQIGHTAKSCPQLHSSGVTANCAHTSSQQDQKWLLDSAASHNITGDLANLTVHSEYDGTDEVVIGDGSGLAVSHIGSLTLNSPTRTFILRDTLCVPNICKNLISVHHFTSQNNVFLEFHPSHFLMKDPITGATLLRGACESSVYHFPNSLVGSSSKIVANVHERTSFDGWHKRLGHPSFKVVQSLVNHFSLPIMNNKMTSLCSSCSINKAHQLPFRPTSFQSHAPLDLIYTDVWGPAHCVGLEFSDENCVGLDGSRYYLIFIDHYGFKKRGGLTVD